MFVERPQHGAVRARLLVPLLLGLAATVTSGPGNSQDASEHYRLLAESVEDLKTGLTWQRQLSPSRVTFAAAGEYCSTLELASHTDWRVPTMQELQTIVDETRSLPAVNAGHFPNTPGLPFWSASTWAGTPELAWYVDFATGTALYDLATSEYHVRCVR